MMSNCPQISFKLFLKSINHTSLKITETYHPTLKSDFSILERTRPTNYLGFIQEGSLKYVFNNTSVILPKNSIMLIPSNLKHSIISKENENVSFYTIHFHSTSKIEKPFHFTLMKPQKAIVFFNNIYHYDHNKSNINNTSLLNSLLICLMHEILEQYINTNFLTQNTYLKIEEIKKAIDSAPLRLNNVSSLSNQFGLSRKYATTLFKKRYGLSIKSYIIKKRLEHATFLLEESNLTLTQIALTCGYSDPYAFSKQYKKYMGISPSLWNKQK